MADLPLQVFDSGMDDRLLAIEKLDPTCRPLLFFHFSLIPYWSLSFFFCSLTLPSLSGRKKSFAIAPSPGPLGRQPDRTS
jgi:hypothetical protein